MVGAIDFLRAWRDLCNEPKACEDCPAYPICKETDVQAFTFSDDQINKLVGTVMSWKHQQEGKNQSGQT